MSDSRAKSICKNTAHDFDLIFKNANSIKQHYVIVKHNCSTTRDSGVVAPNAKNSDDLRNILSQAFTDKRNALEVMETFVFDYVTQQDGADHARKCLFDEKRFIRKGLTSSIAKKHYITRNASECPDKFSIWRKYKVSKSSAGLLYGEKRWEETIVEKQFSVELIRIPSSVLSRKHPTPVVTYRKNWYQALYLNENETEDQNIFHERFDLAQAYSAVLNESEFFQYLYARLDEDSSENRGKDTVPLNLPKIRHVFDNEFAEGRCSLAGKFIPDNSEIPQAPPCPAPESLPPADV